MRWWRDLVIGSRKWEHVSVTDGKSLLAIIQIKLYNCVNMDRPEYKGHGLILYVVKELIVECIKLPSG